MASVVDIAREVGVSPSTVCRALNGRGQINADTRKRVLAAVDRLGYVRNDAASNLRLRRSDTIACLMPDGENELHIDKLHMLKRGAIDAGWKWRHHPYRDQDECDALLSEMIAGRPAGIVLNARVSGENLARLRDAGIPVVAYDQDLRPYDSVVLDRICGVQEGVGHMLGNGRRRILLLGSGLRDQRGLGYVAAHEDAGVKVDRKLVVDQRFGRDLYAYGYEQTAAALSRVAFDGISAVNDACAIGAIRALSEAGKSVPGDVAVLGFDDIAVSRYSSPSISTVAQPIEQMASRTIQLLFDRMSGLDAPRRVEKLVTSLVLRESA